MSLSIAVWSRNLAILGSFDRRSISCPLPCETAVEMAVSLSCALPRGPSSEPKPSRRPRYLPGRWSVADPFLLRLLGYPGQRNPSTEALPHKESEFRACSGELGLDRAFSDSENIRGFASGEAVQFAQLKCSPQRR